MPQTSEPANAGGADGLNAVRLSRQEQGLNSPKAKQTQRPIVIATLAKNKRETLRICSSPPRSVAR